MYNLKPKNEEEVNQVAEEFANSLLVPSRYQNQPLDCCTAIKAGMLLGFNAFQSLQNISVIDGKPTMWSSVLNNLISNHQDPNEIKETIKMAGVITREELEGE